MGTPASPHLATAQVTKHKLNKQTIDQKTCPCTMSGPAVLVLSRPIRPRSRVAGFAGTSRGLSERSEFRSAAKPATFAVGRDSTSTAGPGSTHPHYQLWTLATLYSKCPPPSKLKVELSDRLYLPPHKLTRTIGISR